MSDITTIPIKKETRQKLSEFANKSETWNDVINRLYENAMSVNAANIFFSGDSISIDEFKQEMKKW